MNEMKVKVKDLIIELYYDSTVEPFETPQFNLKEVERLLKILKKFGVEIKIVDTAGWSRKMLSETFKQISAKEKSFQEVFGSKKRKGWFFGREVPGVLIIQGKQSVEVYPRIEKNGIKTVEDGLKKLVRSLGGAQNG